MGTSPLIRTLSMVLAAHKTTKVTLKCICFILRVFIAELDESAISTLVQRTWHCGVN